MIEFGNYDRKINYYDRLGAYAIVFNDKNQIAIVKNSLGYFLPGGGIETGEDKKTCLEREFIEETGYKIKIIRYIDKVAQYFYGEPLKRHIKNTAYIFQVELTQKSNDPLEEDHEMCWMYAEEASNIMYFEYQSWIIERYAVMRGIKLLGETKEATSDKVVYHMQKATKIAVINNEREIIILEAKIEKNHKLPNEVIKYGEGVKDTLKEKILMDIGEDIEIIDCIGAVIEYRDKNNEIKISYAYLAKTEVSKERLIRTIEEEIKTRLNWIKIEEVNKKLEHEKPINYIDKFTKCTNEVILRELHEYLRR